ncbi:hypothetical protein [Aedoeadaptatus coxii]|uniref:hypothetical protein n=1 Tax=Aedoeadaptatus coxii TaxID=755172 RepID=UPI0018DEB448|nr:hypothetical protein [Peptoniphilus coxii]
MRSTIEIQDECLGAKVGIDDRIFYGVISDITGKADNDETGRDSLTLYDGKNYIFFSDNEIKSIEILD